MSCPVCLQQIDWRDPPLYRLDAETGEHVELTIPLNAGPERKARLRRTARIRCPSPEPTEHHLPAAYGEFGPPVVLGFVGARGSGKTHLLAAMVRAIERGDLSRHHGLSCWPLDILLHQQYLRDQVDPLFAEARRLSPTPADQMMFADAFVVARNGGTPRPVALFDIAGDALTRVADAAAFIDATNGLVFVADPTRLDGSEHREPAFGAVLDLLRASGRLPEVSAAIVLTKADRLRFEEPLALWLRRDTHVLTADESLRESADVYAYLHQRGAHAWTRPYRECARATLHLATATGANPLPNARTEGGDFDLGVHPSRVLRPLVALLAMTGVLDSPEAARIGT